MLPLDITHPAITKGVANQLNRSIVLPGIGRKAVSPMFQILDCLPRGRHLKIVGVDVFGVGARGFRGLGYIVCMMANIVNLKPVSFDRIITVAIRRREGKIDAF